MNYLGGKVFTDLKTTRLSRCRMVWLLPKPPPSLLSRQQVGSLSQASCLSPVERGGGGGGGAKSNNGEKTWSSINNSILCVSLPCLCS